MPAPRGIFLSYARDDAAAARHIAEALRAAGLEVWFDENELTGGDAWDQKIRTQIGECALFVPVISANTQARLEGYFRLEWRLAEQRSHLMAKGKRFLVPVCIDDTREKGAQVPDAFLEVQWTRLSAGAASSQFVELVKRLVVPMEPRRPRPGERGEGAASPPKQSEVGRRVPLAAWVGVIAVIAAGITAAFFATRKSDPAPPALPNAGAGTRPPTAEKSAAPTSEARKLVEQARKLYEPWDLASREDFVLAEQMLKRAVDLDPADGEAWAAYALMKFGGVYTGSLYGNEDRALAATLAERALKLAPESGTARLARAFSLRTNGNGLPAAEQALRDEVARQPANKLVVRTLGAELLNRGRRKEAFVFLDQAAALPGGDPIALYLQAKAYLDARELAEAEATIDKALALAPTYNKAHVLKVSLLLDYHDDIERAKAHLASVPRTFFSGDHGAVMAGLIWLYARDVTKCIGALRYASEYPDVPYFIGFTGPKAYLTGLAQHVAGNEEAARSDWRAALRVVEQRLNAQPNASVSIGWRAMLLASLGEKAGADELLRELVQRRNTGDTSVTFLDIAQIQLLQNRPDDALAGFPSAGRIQYFATRNRLRYDPVWDPLRGNPRFEALLKTREQKK